jgi:hypothetical protein
MRKGVDVTTWHLDPGKILCYVSGTTDLGFAASAELHLLRCADCRQTLSSAVPKDRLDRIWDAIALPIVIPARGPVQRYLTLLRPLTATPSRRLGWVGTAALAVGIAVAVQGPAPVEKILKDKDQEGPWTTLTQGRHKPA